MPPHPSRGEESFTSPLRPEYLLGLYRGEVRDPVQRARLEQWIESDPVAKLHWNSLRYIDAERDAARHDVLVLQKFTATVADDACKLVACTDGEAFEPLWRSQGRAFGRSRQQWAEVCERCAYCRRMRRAAYGRFESRAAPLHGEPLLREQFLAPYYERIMAEKTGLLVDLVEETVRPQLAPLAPAAEETTASDIEAMDTAFGLAADTETELAPTKIPLQKLEQAAPQFQRAAGQLPPLHSWLIALCNQRGLTPQQAAEVLRPHFALRAEDVQALLQAAEEMVTIVARMEAHGMSPAERSVISSS